MALAESMRSCFETDSLFGSSDSGLSESSGSQNNAYFALNARSSRIRDPYESIENTRLPRPSFDESGKGRTSSAPNARTTRSSTQSHKHMAANEHDEIDLLLNASSLASSVSIEAPISHPSVAKKRKWKSAVRAQEGFQKPDAFGNVECTLCKFGIFDSETGSGTTRLMRIYERQIGQMHDETLYRYMATYWNDNIATDTTGISSSHDSMDVDSDDIIIPKVNVSQIHFHFESCFSRRNVVGILFGQMDKLLKIQNRVYENGVFVRTVSEEEQQMEEMKGAQKPTPVLTQDANGNIIDEYANTIRSAPPEQNCVDDASDNPMFSQITDMIKRELEFIKKLQAEIPSIENPNTRKAQEQLINTHITKVFKDIRKCQAMEKNRKKKVDKKYLVHSKEAAVFRDYNRAILYTIRGLKEWRDVSAFMDGDADPGAPRKKRGIGRPNKPQIPGVSDSGIKKPNARFKRY